MEIQFMKINEIKTINKGLYTGYIWRSNAKDLEIINGNIPEDLQTLDCSKNPFIIEAQLIDTAKEKSYSVKYADGKYYAYQYDIQNYDLEEVKKNNIKELVFQEFQSHRMDTIKLQFIQRWTEKKDEYCEGMQVLQPAELIFVGFKEEEKKS